MSFGPFPFIGLFDLDKDPTGFSTFLHKGDDIIYPTVFFLVTITHSVLGNINEVFPDSEIISYLMPSVYSVQVDKNVMHMYILHVSNSFNIVILNSKDLYPCWFGMLTLFLVLITED